MNERSKGLIDCLIMTRPCDELSELVEGLKYTDIDLTPIVAKANKSKLGYERALILLAIEVKLNPEITDNVTFQAEATYLPAILDILCNDEEATDMMLDKLDFVIEHIESQLQKGVIVNTVYKLIGSAIRKSIKSLCDDKFRLNGYTFDGFSMIKGTCLISKCNLIYWTTQTVIIKINILTGKQRILDVLEEYSDKSDYIPDKLDLTRDRMSRIVFNTGAKNECVLKYIDLTYSCISARNITQYIPVLKIRMKHYELVNYSELTSRMFNRYKLVDKGSISYAVRVLEEMYEPDYEKLSIICLGIHLHESCRWGYNTCARYNLAVLYSAYYKYLFFYLHNQCSTAGRRLIDSIYKSILNLLETGEITEIDKAIKKCITEDLLTLVQKYNIIGMIYIPEKWYIEIVCNNLDIIEYDIRNNKFGESSYECHNYNELYNKIIDQNHGKLISVNESVIHEGRQHTCRVIEANNISAIIKKIVESYIVLTDNPFKIYLSNDSIPKYWIESIK